MNRTLTRRYLGYFMIVALSVAVVSFNSVSLFRREAYNRTVDVLEGSNAVVRNIIGIIDPGDLDEFIGSIAVDEVRISIIRDDGVVIADSQADVSTLDNHAGRPEIQAALNGVPGVSRRYSDSLREDLIYVALPLIHTNGGSFVIRSSMRVEGLNVAMRGTLINIITIGIITFLALSLISYLSERRLIAPFAEIQKAAEAYSTGNLDYYLSIPSPEDARVVAEAMNAMAESLSSRLAEITENRNELDAVFTGMTEALVVLDENLNILQINHSARGIVVPGIDEPQGLGLIEAFRNTELLALAEETRDSSGTSEGIISFQGHLDQSYHVRGRLIEAVQNRPTKIAMVIVMTDVTRMQQLETMRRDFVANVSHELKTPITNVKGFLETLSDGAIEDPATTQRFLAIATRNANRLNAILDDLLSLSRLEQQDSEILETEIRPVDGVINAALQACAPKASEKGVEMRIEGDKDALARMNVLLIEQALVNLIDNAVKYSGEGTVVIVEVSKDSRRINIAVRDNGTGIPEKDLPRIFERFYRVDKARSRELGGTGLGLAIVKHIALAHGGSVHVESEIGRGSRFSITLPDAGMPS